MDLSDKNKSNADAVVQYCRVRCEFVYQAEMRNDALTACLPQPPVKNNKVDVLCKKKYFLTCDTETLVGFFILPNAKTMHTAL